jgi:aminoglycoside phosphotransferase (APT) family kinase protein
VVWDDDFGPAAVLDWEMASVGPAEMDLGWFVALHDVAVRTSGPDLPGFPERDRWLARYARRLGRPVADLGWYEVFALVRSAAVMARMAALLARVGVDEGWLRRGNPVIDALVARTT